MKVTRELHKQINKAIKEQCGTGVRAELGLRCGVKGEWYNRLDPRDEDGDLFESTPWSLFAYYDFPEVDGRVLLDFYVYGNTGLLTNVMIEIDEQGIGAVYDPAYIDRCRVYTREGYTPHSEETIKKSILA